MLAPSCSLASNPAERKMAALGSRFALDFWDLKVFMLEMSHSRALVRITL